MSIEALNRTAPLSPISQKQSSEASGLWFHRHPFSCNKEQTDRRGWGRWRPDFLSLLRLGDRPPRQKSYPHLVSLSAPGSYLIVFQQKRPKSINYRYFYTHIHETNISVAPAMCGKPKDKLQNCAALPEISSRFRKLIRATSYISNALQWNCPQDSHSDEGGVWGGYRLRLGAYLLPSHFKVGTCRGCQKNVYIF